MSDVLLGNQKIRREPVRLIFMFLADAVGPFKEHQPFTVEDQMSGLVKYREPQLIVRLVSEAQLQQRFGWRQPFGHAKRRTSRGGCNEDDRHARRGRLADERWNESTRIWLVVNALS